MAYADWDFYKNTYIGTVIPASDFIRLSEHASNFIDTITFDRLIDHFPTKERHIEKVKLATCAVADRLYMLELAEQQAINAAKISDSESSSCTGSTSGTEATTGAIKSRSAGSESITYESGAEQASSAKNWSAAFNTAGDEEATNNQLYRIARRFLIGVTTDDGVPVLFAGTP